MISPIVAYLFFGTIFFVGGTGTVLGIAMVCTGLREWYDETIIPSQTNKGSND